MWTVSSSKLNALGRFHSKFDHSRMQRSHTSKKSICGPKILIIGAMKCGTNTIGHLLAKHPRVALNRCEPKGRVRGNYGQCNSDNFQGTVAPQLSFWEGNDLSFKRTKQPDQWLDVLARRLPWTDGVNNITIDKSPSYFNTLKDSETPTLAKSLFPNAKVVATLCNPATRMYSEYEFRMVPKRLHKLKKQFVQYGYEMPKNFVQFTKTILECQRQVEEATEIEDADMEDGELSEEFCDHILRSYLSIGQYAIHIDRWIQEFDDDVLVVNMEMDSVEKVRALLSHIGEDVLPPEEYPWHELQDDESSEFYTNSAYAGRNSAFQDFPNLMKRLQAHYAPYNKVLSEMIGEDFPLTW
ncbi:MAG: hypothetical protein SGILL_010304 [Bacillariaceae sp.]